MIKNVGTTALLVAAIRAQETARQDRLFSDPFAERLAGDVGVQALADYRAAAGPGTPIIEVRTRYYDEALARAGADGIRQVVVLAAGMDARAYRLSWPADLRWFEIDQPEMIEAKASLLSDAQPTCARIAIAANLADDFSPRLFAQGFDASARTVWLVEGLLQYLDAETVARILARIDALSAPSSVLLFDMVGSALLQSPVLKGALEYMKGIGAPWVFGSDAPAALVEKHGWEAIVSEASVIGNAWNRWPFPAIPPQVPGIPRGYLIEAKKR